LLLVVAEDLLELALRILLFEGTDREEPRPLRWRLTREDLKHRIEELAATSSRAALLKEVAA
jgi:hypothetical protein